MEDLATVSVKKVREQQQRRVGILLHKDNANQCRERSHSNKLSKY